MVKPADILEAAYQKALTTSPQLPAEQQGWIDAIVGYAESHKAVLAALVASLTKKIESPNQDVRQHKIGLPNGYSGRVYDTNHVTPFIRQKFRRLAMKSGSGWLTRSIEQDQPFTLDFPGKIRVLEVKQAFLEILNRIEIENENPEIYLIAIFNGLIRQQYENSTEIPVTLATNIPVVTAIETLKAHFHFNYHTAGASRLPVIAIYSIYELLMTTPRYMEKQLLPLKSHTTSDLKSGSIGDIEIANADNTFFEAVEVKYEIPITLTMVQDAFEKIKSLGVSRYYLLTTRVPNTNQASEINEFVSEVQSHYGSEIIVNGVIPSLKYYSRLLDDPSEILSGYERNLLADYEANTDIKRIHVNRWLELRRKILPED